MGVNMGKGGCLIGYVRKPEYCLFVKITEAFRQKNLELCLNSYLESD